MRLRSARRIVFALAIGAATWSLAAVASAADPSPPRIYGGELVERCVFPSAVSIDQGTCTGTLVHPDVVVTAAHCLDGPPPSTVEFGEDYRNPALVVDIVSCTPHPDYPKLGFDIAVCSLAQSVTDVPVVPVLAGCEADGLTIGQIVTIVGFGTSDDDLGDGPKRAVSTDIRDFDLGDVIIGGDCRDSCFGDSGGPVYVQLTDGTWRVFGVTSEGLAFRCGGGGIYTQMHEHLEFLESTAGVDLTPCHDPQGNFVAGAECTAAPTDADQSAGDWSTGCGGGQLARTEVCAAQPGELTPLPGECLIGGGDGDGGTTGFDSGIQPRDEDEGCACAVSAAEAESLAGRAMALAALFGLLGLGLARPLRRPKPPSG